MAASNHSDTFDAVRRAGIFIFLVVATWVIFPSVLRFHEPVLRAASATLVAGLLANLVLVRIFERGHFADFGLGRNGAWKGLGTGFALGFGSVAALTVAALELRLATFERVPIDTAWPLPVLAILLGIGALGEELMFRGYGFQILARAWSAPGMIVATGLLFGLTHFLTNERINPVGIVNTALWGSLLGYAWWRSQTLWLPVGLHFGWNLGLVAIGVPLSGLTIKATGFALIWSAGELFSGGAYGPENGLLTTGCAGAVFLFLRRGGSYSGKARAGGDS